MIIEIPQKLKTKFFEFASEGANIHELVELMILTRRAVKQRESEESASHHFSAFSFAPQRADKRKIASKAQREAWK